MNIFNKALLSKFAWSILNNTSNMWKNLLTKKYLIRINFLEATKKPTDSLFWKSLLQIKDFVKTGCCFRFNNGSSINVWSDPWIPTLSNFIPKPKLDNVWRDQDMTASEFTLEEPRKWNTILLQALFTEETVQETQKIPLSGTNFHLFNDNLN